MAVKGAFDQLIQENVGLLSYVPSTDLLGDDSESTVDGTHPNDLGFLRMAEAIAPTVREALQP